MSEGTGKPRAKTPSLVTNLLQRRGLHLEFLFPGLLALLMLGLGGVVYQTASVMADAYPTSSTAYFVLEQIAFYSLLASIVMTVLGCLLGYILSRMMVRSLREIVVKAQSSSPGAQPPETAFDTRSDGFVEVDIVNRTFNNMMRDIYMSFRQRDSVLLLGSSFGVLTTDKLGNIMAVNPRAEDYLGLPSARLIGNRFDALARSQPEISRIAALVDKVLYHMHTSAEDNLELTDRQGRRRKTLITCTPIRDHYNRPHGCVLMLRPAQRYSDLDKRLREIDRLAMLGTFTVGLVHEIRNPIAAIKGLSQLLGQIEPSSPKFQTFVKGIQSEAARLERLLGELHHLADKSPAELSQPCDLNAILSQTLSGIRFSMPKVDVHIEEQYGNVPKVMGVPDRLMQAFSNILKNAMEATPPGGLITICTRPLVSVENAGDLVQVSITNTGSTIPEDMRGRIFEPFFTTKQGGTGLGLPIATQVVIQHEGSITLHSADNVTTFDIILPAMTGESEKPNVAKA